RSGPAPLLIFLTLLSTFVGATPQTTGGVDVATRARAYQPGELVMVTAAVPISADGLRVRALGHTVPAFKTDDHTWEALVGIDLSVTPGKYVVSVEAADGHRVGEATFTVTPKAFPTRRLT